MKTKEDAQVRNRTIIDKLMGYPKAPLILRVFCVSCGLLAAIFVHGALMINLHNKANKLCEVEAELLNQRHAIAGLENSGPKGEMINRNDVPLAIAELARKARELGLNFSSISSRQIRDTTQAGVRKLPISFTIESEYKNVGLFLAQVEEFPRSVMDIESLSIHPIEDNPSELDVEMVLSMYVEIEDAT